VTVIDVVRTVDVPADLLAACHRLLLDAFDDGFGAEDWEHALGGVHVIATEDGAVVAHAAVVPRMLDLGGRRLAAGYVEAVACDRARRGEGLGTAVMARAGEVIRDQFELGALSTGAHHFYERLGWHRWQGPTYVRRRDGVERTPDEDDGLMVLLVGAEVDLTAAITCEERRGDDW
jgi:aminoglycoside 2'-N-acetyltransferase I